MNRFLCAFLCPVVGAILFGLCDLAWAFRLLDVEFASDERLLILVYGTGRHVLIGIIFGALGALVMAAPTRPKRWLDPRVLTGAAVIGALWDWSLRNLTEGPKISVHWIAPFLHWGLMIGGPLGIFVALRILRPWIVAIADGSGRRLRVGLGLLALGAMAFTTRLNITLLPGHYPGVHMLWVVFALLCASAAVFCLVGRALALGRLRPALALVVAAGILGGALWLEGRDTFQATRSYSSTVVQGANPHAELIDLVFKRFATTQSVDIANVLDLVREMEQAGSRDLTSILDQVLPQRRDYNILLIAVDTVRWDHTGLAGYTENPTTPVLEQLGREGFVFTNAYTPYPTSNYAYASVLTGLTAGATPLHGYRSKLSWKFPDTVHYPELVSRAGMNTIGVTGFGKIERRNMRFFGMLETGFDTFNPDQTGDPGMKARAVTDSVLKQLVNRKTRRFFSFVHYMEPHNPYETHQGHDFGTSARDRYDSEIAHCDAEIGRLIDGLKQRKLWDNTVVCVFSDHGEGFGDHGFPFHNSSLYEEEIRVPLLIRIPGLQAGKRIDTPVSLVDVMPTCLAVADIGDPEERMGQSLLPYMLDQEGLPDRVIFSQQYSPRQTARELEQRCVVYRGLKLIEVVRKNPDWFLFDLEQDPRERRNLFNQPEYSKRQAVLAGLLSAQVESIKKRVGGKPLDDPAVALQAHLETALMWIRAPDQKKIRRAITYLRTKLRNRYAGLNLLCEEMPAQLMNDLHAEILKLATGLLPKRETSLYNLLLVLPRPENEAYFSALMKDKSPTVRADGAVGLVSLGLDAGREELLAMCRRQRNPVLRFPYAVALGDLGHGEFLPDFVRIIRGNATREVVPLLRALARSKEPAGLDALTRRLALNELFDYTIRRSTVEYASAVGGARGAEVLLYFASEPDPTLRDVAIAGLRKHYGDEFDQRIKEFAELREARDALVNGKAELATQLFEAWLEKTEDPPPGAALDLARARVHLGRQTGAAAALDRAIGADDPRAADAARRMKAHIKDLRWFYPANDFKVSIEVIRKPPTLRRNRCYFIEVKVTNRAKVYWHGGHWNFGPVLRCRLVDTDGQIMKQDTKGKKMNVHVINNFLPLRGLEPGESVNLTLVGHAPAGAWKDARIAVSFSQYHTDHIPDDRDFPLVVEQLYEPK